MIPDDPELRRAFDARSGNVTPQFRARMHGAVAAGRPARNFTPAIALVTVVALTAASVGILLAARTLGHPLHGGLVSAARTADPSPLPSESPVELPSQAFLSAPSRDVVWAFVDFRLLFQSTDGGQTWQRRQLPVEWETSGPVTFSFADADNGWALVSGSPATECQAAAAQVWRTSDGAKTWLLIASVDADHNAVNGLGAAQCKASISFVDKTNGFVTAWDDNSAPTIYRTTDGGSTWKSSRLPDPPGFKTTGAGFVLNAHEVFGFGTTLLLSAYGMQPSGARGYAFKSTDGGATWVFAAAIPSPSIDVAFVTESRWLQVILPGQSMETSDAGKSWHLYASDYGQAAPVAPQVVFGDPSVGYATVRGSIQRTEDGGLHWTYIKTPGT
jgi:photosystem II stability/assembly factor-like uncharacterized protein